MNEITRRDVIKKLAYVAPAILTLKANPSFAQGGSGFSGDSDYKRKGDGSSWSRSSDSGCGSNFFERIACWFEEVL